MKEKKLGEGEFKLIAIVAMTPERIIGNENELPWRIPEDLKMFKRITSGHSIVMGRKTWDSLGNYKPLPNRQNIVMTRDQQWQEEGVVTIHSPEDLNALQLQSNEVYIIGGAQIYQLFLPYLDELIVSHVFEAYPGDTKFPQFSTYFEDYEVISRYDAFEVRRYRAKSKHCYC